VDDHKVDRTNGHYELPLRRLCASRHARR
jgi:hypothetical protein